MSEHLSDFPATPPLPVEAPVVQSSVGKRLAHLVNNEEHADFHFIILNDGDRRIPAHKLIVGAGSEELHRIVYGAAWQTVDAGNTTEVDECSTDAFVEVLRYLYTDEVSISSNTLRSTSVRCVGCAIPT